MKYFPTLLFFLFVLFANVEGVAQQTHTLTQGGQSQYKWLVSEQAEAVVQTEIDNLSNQLSQMTAGGAAQEDIAKLQFHLAVYYHFKQALNQGKSTQESYEGTWAILGAGDDASMITPQEKQTLQNSTRNKLTE